MLPSMQHVTLNWLERGISVDGHPGRHRGLGSMIRGGTGGAQMAFGGQGYVLVQPSESVPQGGHQSKGPDTRRDARPVHAVTA